LRKGEAKFQYRQPSGFIRVIGLRTVCYNYGPGYLVGLVAKLLIVDDDIALCESLKALLTGEKHLVDVVNNGLEALDFLKNYDYDLVLLDWNLPGCEGIEVCKRYRESGGDAFIIMLTGQTAEQRREEGLDTGADDYVTKPFYARELCARIRAMLRRPSASASSTTEIGKLSINMQRHEASVDGKVMKLMPLELALLEFIVRHPNDVFSGEALLKRLWDADADVGVDSVYACLTRLRKSLKAAGLPNLIQTVHGVGYRFVPPSE
jgi:DNA-binding response OmpR family regulator